MADLNLVAKLGRKERAKKQFALRCISPDDAKYGDASEILADYLTAEAEWKTCALVQMLLLETRVEFGQASSKNLLEVRRALKKISPLNMSLLEDQVTRHDQLAVIEEIGRFVSDETKALLHPGTTSYDILDTVRSFLFKTAYGTIIRPEVAKSIEKLCALAERSMGILQVGRTHLQNTSPVPLGATFAGYARRLAERLDRCDYDFEKLRGKISGIVGTGAGVEMVVGEGNAERFERAVLEKLGLKPDYAATQIVQKERLADIGHDLVTLELVLGDFANDIRILYSSAINEVTSRDNAARLGGSSADATKNNPVNYENIAGTSPLVAAGMFVLYSLVQTDLMRDLRGSKPARYQPQAIMAETYESFLRLNKSLPQLSINEDKVAANLQQVRDNPSEAMVSILRGEPSWVHSKYGLGHDFVRQMGIKAQKQGRPLLEVALEDPEFTVLYGTFAERKREILQGKLEKYVGFSASRARENIAYAREIAGVAYKEA